MGRNPLYKRTIMQNDPLALTLTQSFEIERMNRVIDECTNLEEIKSLTKQLVSAWHSQKAATAWVMRQHLSSPSKIKSL